MLVMAVNVFPEPVATGGRDWISSSSLSHTAPGRTLSDGDIAHYQKIVVALNETIRLMQEIDEVIEQHGGWPGAFTTSLQADT